MENSQGPQIAGLEGRSARARTSVNSCQRCRDQKLKCNREIPICTRCKKRKANCFYPSRTPRTRSRAQRFARVVPYDPGSGDLDADHPPRQLDANGASIQDASPGREEQRPLTANRPEELARMSSELYPTHLRSIRTPATGTPTGTGPVVGGEGITAPAPLPSRVAGLVLLEIYFERIYNSSLLFHKPAIFQEYLQGTLPAPLLKVMFALAALFLAPVDRHGTTAPTDFAELSALGIYHSRGPLWAKEAMNEALLLITDEPSLPIVQTLECLTIYWFGIGNPRRGDLCLALAYRFCCILGFKTKAGDNAQGHQSPLESELRRRCLWACWTSMCILAEPEPYIRAAWSEVALMPLPAAIFSTSTGWNVTMGDSMDANWSLVPGGQRLEKCPDPPPAAALVQIIGVWAKIQLFVSDCKSYTSSMKVDSLSSLSELLCSIYNTTVPPPHPTKTTIGEPLENAQVFMTCSAIYHLSQITLHSTIVPLFSGSPSDEAVDPNTVKYSANIVVQHADSFVNLLERFLNGGADLTYVPPLVGHGAFVTAAVLLLFEISHRDKVGNQDRPEVNQETSRRPAIMGILSMLNTLRVYLKALQTPWERLQAAVRGSFQEIHPHPSTSTVADSSSRDRGGQVTWNPSQQTPQQPTDHGDSLFPSTADEMNFQTGRGNDGLASDMVSQFNPQEESWWSVPLIEQGGGQSWGFDTGSIFHFDLNGFG